MKGQTVEKNDGKNVSYPMAEGPDVELLKITLKYIGRMMGRSSGSFLVTEMGSRGGHRPTLPRRGLRGSLLTHLKLPGLPAQPSVMSSLPKVFPISSSARGEVRRSCSSFPRGPHPSKKCTCPLIQKLIATWNPREH